MKKGIYVSLLAITALVVGCGQDDRTLSPPGSKLEGIHATWELFKVVTVDTINEIRVDITPYFLVGGAAPELNMNSDNFSFSFNDQGKKNYIGESGSWSFDDNEAPTLINMVNEKSETVILGLNRTIRPTDPYLSVKLVRSCGETPRAVYNYYFKRKQ